MIPNKEKILKLHRLHEKGFSCVYISKLENVTPVTINNWFNKYNLKIERYSRQKTTVVNDYFFSKIDSEIKAYLLGFIAADGNVYKHKHSNSYYLNINVHMQDLYIIELIQKYISPTSKIQFKQKNNQYKIAITSKQLFFDLGKLGIIPNKTYSEINTLLKIPKYLRIDFIRGYFDGDGTVGVYKDKKQHDRYNYIFSIVSKKSLVLAHIMQELNATLRLTYNLKTDVFYLRSNYKKSIKKLYFLLYTNANYFFRRKRNKFKKIKLS